MTLRFEKDAKKALGRLIVVDNQRCRVRFQGR